MFVCFYLKNIFVAYVESLYITMLDINFTYIHINFTLVWHNRTALQ